MAFLEGLAFCHNGLSNDFGPCNIELTWESVDEEDLAQTPDQYRTDLAEC